MYDQPIAMFVIRFRLTQLIYLQMANAELIPPRWKTFVQLCSNTPAVVTASTHLPIFLSLYFLILTHQGGRSFGLIGCDKHVASTGRS